MNYVSLHCHTVFSSLDGHALVRDHVATAKALGHSHVAITDHGTMAGVPELVKECRDKNVAPVIGMEAYVKPEGRELRGKDDNGETNFHLTLLALDRTGYVNLCQLATRANCEGYYYKPRVDWELLEQHNQGLVVLSGCASGELGKAILRQDDEAVDRIVDFYSSVFPHRYFLEFQDHGDWQPQIDINYRLYDLEKRTNLPVVATNDSHFCAAEEYQAQQMLIAVHRNQSVEKVESGSPWNYFRSNEEMSETFPRRMLDGTLQVASWVAPFELGSRTPKLPPAPQELGTNQSAGQIMRVRVTAGLERRLRLPLRDVPLPYLERMNEEFRVIDVMSRSLGTDFGRYLLMIADICDYAEQNGIWYGPRGSAAGSLVCWCLGISPIDPISHNLVFERFLNPYRIEMPDVDIDFQDNRREQIFRYVAETYGHDNVARIGTYQTIGSKQSIKDASKALSGQLPKHHVAFAEDLIQMIPDDPRPGGMPLEELFDVENPQGAGMRDACNQNDMTQTVMDYALALEGRHRGTAMHAAGVVVADRKVSDLLPLSWVKEARKNPDVPIPVSTQYEMGHLEALGLLKIDILGLKTLSVLDLTMQIVADRWGTINVPNLWELDWDDAQTWDLINSGKTLSMFQIGSEGQGKACFELQPRNLEDLALTIAIYRPGPLQNFPLVVGRKNHGEPIDSIHPVIDPILLPTYGIPVFQEQIMRIAQEYAGFSVGESDVLRKAMSKKNREKMQEEHRKFWDRAREHGRTDDETQHVWDFIAPFADYGFNRAHAVCYAYLAYQTAWLKTHFTVEFYCAAMTVERSSGGDGSPRERIGALIREAKTLGIPTLPPDIDRPTVDFMPEGHAIRYGFAAVKDASADDVRRIVDERANGPFTSVAQTVARCKGVKSPTFKALAQVGAFDSFGWSRRALVDDEEREDRTSTDKKKKVKDNPGLITRLIAHRSKSRERPDLAPFDESAYDDRPEYGPDRLLKFEQDGMGMFITPLPKRNVAVVMCDELADHAERVVTMQGVLTQVSLRVSKRDGNQWASCKLLDETGETQATVFQRLYPKVKEVLKEGTLVLLTGRVQYSKMWGLSLIVNQIEPVEIPDTPRTTRRPRVMTVGGSIRGAVERIGGMLEVARECPGQETVEIRYQDETMVVRVSPMGLTRLVAS